MSFEVHTRNLALAPALAEALLPQLLATYGEDLPDGPRMIRTIGAHWDDTAHTRIRAAEYLLTVTDRVSIVTDRTLTDGRIAFSGILWQSDLAAEFDANGIVGVEELTDAQLAALTPAPTPMP
jgi:hypothetical protein